MMMINKASHMANLALKMATQQPVIGTDDNQHGSQSNRLPHGESFG